MTYIFDSSVLGLLLAEILGSAMRVLLLAGAASLGLSAFRVKSTSLRLLVWTSVLYGALAMPFLGRFLPAVQVPAPVFLQQESAASRESVAPPPAAGIADPTSMRSTVAGMAKISAPKSASRPAHVPEGAGELAGNSSPAWSLRSLWQPLLWNIAAGLYFAVALVLVARIVVGMVLSRRLIRSSQLITDTRVVKSAADNSARSRSKTPPIVESELISVPVTLGALRSTILLPSAWREWDAAKLHAVIAHEMSHVSRGDALTQCLSLLHRAIFWFSPVAWWLNRHLATLAEQASDEAALACGADRNEYARTLLGFFEDLHSTPGRVWWQGVSMAKAGQAEHRLERILAWRGAVTMGLKKSFIVTVVALAVPVVYLAASVRPASPSSSGARTQQSAPPAPAPVVVGAPVAAVPPAAPIGGVPGLGPTGGVPAVAPVAPAILAMPPAPPSMGFGQGHGSGTGHGDGYSYAFGFDDEERFVIVSGKSDSYTMSGSTQDIRHVEKLKKQIPGAFIWFQRDEKSYIIRDQTTVDRAKAFWAPQEELGKKQEELGKQQEALGKQQEELGAKMEQVRVNVPDMTATLDKLKAKLQKLGPSATMEQIGELQSEIGELQSKIGEIQSQAGEQQSKLGDLQGALGEKQGKLGEQQGELGRQQGELAEKASRQMKELLDEAIKNGTAKPEADTQRDGSL